MAKSLPFRTHFSIDGERQIETIHAVSADAAREALVARYAGQRVEIGKVKLDREVVRIKRRRP